MFQRKEEIAALGGEIIIIADGYRQSIVLIFYWKQIWFVHAKNQICSSSSYRRVHHFNSHGASLHRNYSKDHLYSQSWSKGDDHWGSTCVCVRKAGSMNVLWGNKDVIWMMELLHIEMAYVSAIGDWIDGSGWVEAFQKAHISTPGPAESFLSGSKVKRTRYAHLVSSSVLLRLTTTAFKNQENQAKFES